MQPLREITCQHGSAGYYKECWLIRASPGLQGQGIPGPRLVLLLGHATAHNQVPGESGKELPRKGFLLGIVSHSPPCLTDHTHQAYIRLAGISSWG